MGLGTLRLDGFGRRAVVPLRAPFFFHLHFFAENVFVLGVRLRQVVETKALPEFQLAAAFAVALYNQFNAPLDFRGWALPPTTEILVVFDFQLPDVSFELTEILVNGGHGRTVVLSIMLEVPGIAVNDARDSRR